MNCRLAVCSSPSRWRGPRRSASIPRHDHILSKRTWRKDMIKFGVALGLATVTAATFSVASAQQAVTPAPIKIGIVTFLTGPAAAPFGIPGRNAAEILIENLNAGKLPAPYDQVGFGGAKIEGKYVDEAGSTAQQVTEYRNLGP